MLILVDMNLTMRWVPFLKASGHDVAHWGSVGAVSASDQEIFDYARLNGYVLLTNDLDFPRILAHTKKAAADTGISGSCTRPSAHRLLSGSGTRGDCNA